MNNTTKVLVTIGVVVLYILIATPITAAMRESGNSSGFIGIILLVALIGAIKAIWSKPKHEDNKGNTDNDSLLQKE